MKKMTLLLLMGSIAQTSLAQPTVFKGSAELIVANGGVFETMPPFADRATIGIYDPIGHTYSVFDTIHVEGVSDVEAAYSFSPGGGYEFYFAGVDSLIKYDQNYQRVAALGSPGIRMVQVFYDENLVVTGKWYGSGDYVTVRDRSSMNVLFSVPDSIIWNTVYDAALVNDSLYIAYNIPGTVDACPPFGCFTDSLGMIGVLSASSQAFVRNIELDTAGAGIRGLTSVGNDLVGVCEVSGNLVVYNTITGQQTIMDENLTRYMSKHEDAGVAYVKNGEVYHTNTLSAPVATGQMVGFPNAMEYDFKSGDLYYTETDWATYGQLHIQNGFNDDSLFVGISPDAMDVRYEYLTGVQETELKVSLYPNPSRGLITLDGLGLVSFELHTLEGRLLESRPLRNGVNALDFSVPAGVYTLRITGDKGHATRRIIIQ